jgi:predicted N-acetyltransferase YhbS
MVFDVRQMNEGDIADADAIRAAVGWNQRPSDWLRLLKYEPTGCFVAIANQRVVGTVTTTRYGTALAWIGMMLVHPDWRSRGLGRSLMTAAIDYLRHAQTDCIMLDATPAGQPLYESMGFKAVWPFHRWVKKQTPTTETNNAHSCRISSLGALAQHHQLDLAAFGCERWNYLTLLAADSDCMVTEQGFAMVRSGSLAQYLGPVVAPSQASAGILISELLKSTHADVFWDVPEINSAAHELAIQNNFHPTRPLLRMQLGGPAVYPDLSKQFAMADPGTG